MLFKKFSKFLKKRNNKSDLFNRYDNKKPTEFNTNNIHALDVVNRVILKLNVPKKRGKTSRSMRRKENQEELIMMTHRAPLQVMKKKLIYV